MKLEELGIESEEELKELENNGKLFIYRAPEGAEKHIIEVDEEKYKNMLLR